MTLHERLIARQSGKELQRKRDRARRKAIWTQEDVDFANRWASHMLEFFAGEQKSSTSHINNF